ncbi:MAG: hypothetical protein KC656_33510, partial [Myxococcales bacterium]|nr:hypothetical protein [Myxococcales bacterium]
KRRVKVPLHVDRTGLGVTATLGVAADAPKIRLDSGALSRTLEDHIAQHCGKDEICDIWVEATFGPLVASPLDPPGTTLAVRNVVGRVEDPAAARMQIENP